MEFIQVKYVPADENLPTEIKEIPNDLSAFKTLVEGWIETVKTQSMFDKKILMLVNEDGIALHKPLNPRAMRLSEYPGPIVGDAVFVGWDYHPDSDWHDYPSENGFTIIS